MMLKRGWSIKDILKEIAVTLALLFVVSSVLNYIRQPKIEETIYDYKLRDIEGKIVDFHHYKGKPLVVHFWGIWCPTCRFEASNIDAISKEYAVVTIAVNSGTDESIEKFLKNNALSYRVVNDQMGTLAKAFNIEVYPTTLLYNSKGELKYVEVGYTSTLGLKARLELLN